LNERLFTSTIIEALGRNGALRVDELFKNVSKLHGDMDRRSFEETLMVMELQGLIRILSLTRDKRRVELVKG